MKVHLVLHPSSYHSQRYAPRKKQITAGHKGSRLLPLLLPPAVSIRRHITSGYGGTIQSSLLIAVDDKPNLHQIIYSLLKSINARGPPRHVLCSLLMYDVEAEVSDQ